MKQKQKLFLAFFILITIVGIFAVILTLDWKNILAPTPHPPRIVTATTNFEEIWQNNDILIGGKTGRGSKGFLQSEADSIFSLVVLINPISQDWVLRKQKMNDGSIQWEKNLPMSVRAVQMDDQNLFVMTTKQIPCGGEWRPECESIIMTVYDAIDGEEVLTHTYEGLLNIGLVEINDSSIIIHGSANRGNRRATYFIDKMNGDLLQSTEPQYSLREINGQYIDPQSMLDDPNFIPISNVIEQDETIYFVSNESQLLALRKDSRSILGSVEFVPNDRFISPNSVTILADGNIIIVYFEDSRQIFSFRFLPTP